MGQVPVDTEGRSSQSSERDPIDLRTFGAVPGLKAKVAKALAV